jgi:ketosteroid isomerase-like protein
MKKISSEDVRKDVQRFWAILSGNLADKLEEMYSPSAIVFTGKAKRSESAKLIAVRRSRQLPGHALSSRAEVGSIDVQIVGPDVAIAAYTYSFSTQKILADGSKVQINAPFGRATQIFQRGEDGALRIVHEHLSAAAPPATEKAGE